MGPLITLSKSFPKQQLPRKPQHNLRERDTYQFVGGWKREKDKEKEVCFGFLAQPKALFNKHSHEMHHPEITINERD